MKTKLLVSLLVGCLARHAIADSWERLEKQEVLSPGKHFRLTIEPEESRSENGAVLCLWESDGRVEKQRFKRRTVNDTSPVRVFVSDDGTVVTLDDWYRAGFDHALVVYSPSGNVVRDSSLDALLTMDQFELVPSSKSSRKWRYSAEPVRMRSDGLELTAVWGAPITIDLKTGLFSFGHDLFPNFVRLAKSDLAALVRVEHQRWSGAVHVSCQWENDSTLCRATNLDYRRTQVSRQRVSRAQLRGGLDPVLQLLGSVRLPTQCAGGCDDLQAVQFYFEEENMEYAYSIEIRHFSGKPQSEQEAFASLLQHFAFNVNPPPKRNK